MTWDSVAEQLAFFPCAAFLTDKDGHVTGWNPFMEELASGTPPLEWIRKYSAFSKWVKMDEAGDVTAVVYVDNRLCHGKRSVDGGISYECSTDVKISYTGNETKPSLSLGPRVVKNWPSGLLFVDRDLVLRYANPVAMAILDIDDSALGKAVHSIFPLQSRGYDSFVTMVLDQTVSRNHVAKWEESGRCKYLLVDSAPVENDERETAGTVWMIKDIGNVASLQQQMQRSDNLATLGKIAAGVAHEIRNPLTSIKGFLQVLKQKFEKSDSNKEREYTDVMLTEIERVNGLVGELLLLSKPRDMQLTPLDLGALINSITPIIKSEALLHDIEFHINLHPVPSVLGDREMLKQVFLNLAKNAIEAMESAGSLTITTGYVSTENMVRIDFQDTGPGIPPYLTDRIFDAFFTTKEKGTGLGLSICQRIIHDLGGTIRVSSKGYGTTFSVLLPELLSDL